MVTPHDPWNADRYATHAGFVASLGATLLDLLDPRPGEHILDLGCGDGALTVLIAARGATVTGVDASPDMVRAARARRLDAVCMDGQALAFDRQFDAVFSNAALHWMADPAAVLRGVARALKPGGRFVAEFGGFGNVAAIATALRASLRMRGLAPAQTGIWFFPTEAECAALLQAAGFTVKDMALLPRPTPLPFGLRGWLEAFAGPFLACAGAPLAEQRETLFEEVEALLAPALRDQAGVWIADYVRVRFRARLEGLGGSAS